MVRYLGSNPDPSVQQLLVWTSVVNSSLAPFFLVCGMEWWLGSPGHVHVHTRVYHMYTCMLYV